MGLVMPPDSVEEYVCQVSTPYLNLDPCYRLHARHPTGARKVRISHIKLLLFFLLPLHLKNYKEKKLGGLSSGITEHFIILQIALRIWEIEVVLT